MLSKIFVLDKGYVAFVDSSLPTKVLRDLRTDLFADEIPDSIRDLCSLTLAVKSPIFMAKYISQFQLRVLTAPQVDNLEAYLPNEGEIGCEDLETSKVIADDIARTTAALLINPKAYQHDGANRFISQLITPINVYTTQLVTGSYNEWQKFVDMQGLPGPMLAYQNAVRQILLAEWTEEHGKAKETTKES